MLNLDNGISYFKNSVDADQLDSGKPPDKDLHCFSHWNLIPGEQ